MAGSRVIVLVHMTSRRRGRATLEDEGGERTLARARSGPRLMKGQVGVGLAVARLD